MAFVFGVRASSFDARYSAGGKVGTKFNAAKITTASGGLSGTVWDLTDATQIKYVSYPGAYNTPNTRAHFVLIRVAPAYSGTPATTRALWSLSSGLGTNGAYLELRHDAATGNLTGIGKNEVGSNTLAVINFGVWNPTAGTYYDLAFVWAGTTAANGVKLYVDGVLLGSGGTATNALLSTWDNTYWKNITIGSGLNLTTSACSVDEFVIGDDATIDVTNVALVGGNGSLNGASRTALVNTTAFDGRSNTEPGIANVRLSTGYTVAGVAYTGTAAIPTAANVRSGTATDATTGTLAVPAAGDVRSGTAVDNTTGTLAVPAASNVRSGTAVDNTTGTAAIPAAANVRLGTAVDATTGTAAIPTAANVRSGTATDNTTGTLVVPAVGNVRFGTSVDNTTGTLVVPTAANVRSGTAVDATTGTLAVPSAVDVRDGVIFDATTEGSLDLPDEADVKVGVQFDGATKTGTYAANCVYPDEADVREGTMFGEDTLEGTLAVPSADDVRAGIAVDDEVGTLDVNQDEVTVIVDESETIEVQVEG